MSNSTPGDHSSGGGDEGPLQQVLRAGAESIIDTLEEGDVNAAMRKLKELSDVRDKTVYEEVGRLTRHLHEALTSFKADAESKLEEVAARDDTPALATDAKDRLGYVMELTADAANRTMDMVDEAIPIAGELGIESTALRVEWQKLARRELAAGEFALLYKRIDKFLQFSEQKSNRLHSILTDILLAQGYQDLSGQVITKVITLVQEMESSLLNLVLVASNVEQITAPPGMLDSADETTVEVDVVGADIAAEGPILNAEQRSDVVKNQDDVDELLSSLGF